MNVTSHLYPPLSLGSKRFTFTRPVPRSVCRMVRSVGSSTSCGMGRLYCSCHWPCKHRNPGTRREGDQRQGVAVRSIIEHRDGMPISSARQESG